MKRKLFPALAAVLILALALALAGCAPRTAQAEYIGIDAAKTIALEAAGVSESAAVFSTAGLDRQNGTDYYAVDFTANGRTYAYDIDAVTGVIIDSSEDQSQPAQATDGGASADSANSSGTSSQSTGGSAAITEDQAREIALADADLTAEEVTFLKTKLDRDDGRLVYDVEFYTADYTEYDYEIDAADGTILSSDFDAEGYTAPADSATAITADQAKEIALAEVPGATVDDIYEFELDRDDGRLEYEGAIWYDGTEYEFTIDGYSGAIRSWEADLRSR
mgnify:CR=1 FL=1